MEDFQASRAGPGRDPLILAISRVAIYFGTPDPKVLFNALPRDEAGLLPFHQADAALDIAGFNHETSTAKRLPRRPEAYPLIARMKDGVAIALLELSGTDVLSFNEGADDPVWISLSDFDADFAGEFISVVANPDALRAKDAPWHAKGRSHWFWSELRKERKAFRAVLLASVLINTLALSLPLFSMNVYDRVIPNRAEASLWILASGVLLAFLLEFALRTARTNVVDDIGRRLDLRLSQKLFSRVLSTPMSGRRGSTGALAARVGEYALVREFFASTTVVLIVDLAFLILFIAVIAYIAGWLALVPLLTLSLMAIAGMILQRKVIDAARDAQADAGLQQTVLVEAVAGMETLKSIAGERRLLGKWQSLARIGSQSQLRLRQISSTAVALASSFQQISSVSLVVGGYYLFASGQITMGAIIAIVMLSARSLAPAGQIAFLLTRGRQAREALASIEALFATEDERRQGSISLPPSQREGYRVNLENVSFAYPGSELASLSDINLKIEPGERIAIVGRIASGKSTLGRLICGLYPPTDGAIRIEGIDSRQFYPAELRSSFRFVGQDANLFTGSIRDNIALGAPGASDSEIIAALVKTGADGYLTRDAAGFDREVGEQGRTLSGGQRAFLALSRAFMSPFELLYLDEPTGAMDSHTEALLVEKLRSALSKTQTLIVATHRPAMFDICDRIIVLNEGRIVADGPKLDILKNLRTKVDA
ncbi:type I secretion system permease/ATPase [Erythrobacter sp. sf7]|uniref:Type I secretion system permease/ATPase n=1 Tax=Erythrobacter fulvus TaxID=2987523 RepID=A0ABT5JQS3_9SPHN|nr:type I secretion system permease/ATPase [Erythrobacter fulvus]MDC8754954.1 type I secretion system permease/ATPase [Erythrobacter fulvus]